ncbi:related to meiotic recombination protein SPO11 [Sporisorium reilianum f. sp. reilianum]|uniref:Related to meiotic recombination protein SPO11 n=1 Tax=Sporisorium reilianum f. sp. reilianum TaxID=72559 RepID=A0A2N8UIJ0_9BASI|nr:related to meiotic recombination protein SPO11 [Sporisorium reilianum f. sp. reilianum]
MTTQPTTILARIDELMLDLMQQLATQAEVLRSSPNTASSSSSSAPSSQADVERSAKRSKQSGPKVTPLKLATFAATGERGPESSISFPTKSVVGIRRMHLFATQQASDRTIAHVATLLGCDRAALNIVASPRGLVSGPLTLHPPSPSTPIACQPGHATLIPPEIDLHWRVDVRCERPLVLVVEKEAVFTHLLQLRPADAAGAGRVDWDSVVMVTAKGYADQATRALVQLLGVRAVGLFDADPYGVDIHRQFCSAHSVEWIGVDLSDFAPPLAGQNSALVPLRNDERATAVRLLRGLGTSHDDERVRARLTDMLLTGYKAEIEAAYDFAPPSTALGTRGGLVGYIEHKISGLCSSQL